MGKRGKMAFVTLEDESAKLEVSVFGQVYEQYAELLKSDQILVIEAKVSRDDYNGGENLRIVAETIYDLEKARGRFCRGLCLTMTQNTPVTEIAELLQLYRQAEGAVMLKIFYHNDIARGEVKPSHQWKVVPQNALIAELEKKLGKEAVEVLWA